MGTDPEPTMKNKADQQLLEIDKKYSGFIHVSSLLAYGHQKICENVNKMICFNTICGHWCVCFIMAGECWTVQATLSMYMLICISVNPQMKAVAGLKMSYQVQQAINGSKGAVVRGFRHDDSDSALCSHLYTMVRGNRQHRRAFLISLLNLFDDSSVSSPLSFSLILFSVCVYL